MDCSRRVIGAVLLLLITASTLFAHEDTILRVGGGRIFGLPDKYAPSRFDRTTLRLRVGKKTMMFIPALQRVFEDPHDLRVTASWYHDQRILPPYIAFTVLPKKKNFSFTILLNLDTLDLIAFTKTIRESADSTRGEAVELTKGQREQLRRSVTTEE